MENECDKCKGKDLLLAAAGDQLIRMEEILHDLRIDNRKLKEQVKRLEGLTE